MTLLMLGCQSQRSLVPNKVSNVPDYFSTWNIQGYVVSYEGDPTIQVMDEQHMFGNGELEGWTRFFPEFREDLYFLMDDSWDIPAGTHANGNDAHMGEGRLNEERFPGCKGTPTERMKTLVRRTKKAGWKGLGCWLIAHEAETAPDKDNPEKYWQIRLQEHQKAGVAYWKVDYGREQDNVEWRRMITNSARQVAPDVMIEHAYTYPAIEHYDVFRTYDVEVVTSVPVTIQRIVKLLGYKHDAESLGLINCEDEPYVAAGLGCVVGVMRHPVNKELPNGLADHVFPSAGRDLKSRMDEVNRLLKWHRIAAPFGVNNDAEIDKKNLTDHWILGERETWVPNHHTGDTLTEQAPARISRNLPLPTVIGRDSEVPYVLSSRYPNGAIAIAAVERVLGRQWFTPKATVIQKIPNVEHPIGIFGTFESVVLESQEGIPSKARVWAQDLIAKKATDITDEVVIEGNRMTLSGDLIRRIGTQAATPGDKSAPALVLQVKRQ